jgi:hypothetical protein
MIVLTRTPGRHLLLLLTPLLLMLLVACATDASVIGTPEPVVETTAPSPTAVPTPTSTRVPPTVAPTVQATVLPQKVTTTATFVATAIRTTPIPTAASTALPATPTPEAEATMGAALTVDITHLPMGDGRVSSQALSGNVWSCQSTFQDRRIHDGPWLNGDGTFDYTKKVEVPGSVNWPSSFDVMVNGSVRVLTGNSLPSHPTGEFPISRSSEAYSYDPNPNGISSSDIRIELPVIPTVRNQASCLRMGPIGVMLTGGLFFNALDAAGVDAVAHEVRDACDGHPQGQGQYHYHNLTPCVGDVEVGHSDLMGYAFDGFGIYGLRGEDGQLLANDDLGDCHGHTHDVMWDGDMVDIFHYHATWEYPYTIGCYRGTPVTLPR